MEKIAVRYKVINQTKKKPLLSVAMLSYNHSYYIEEAIESILFQKVDFDFQIVIADDKSTDNTREILNKYQSKYPNLFKLIFQNENVGPKQNNIDLLSSLDGTYVAALEGDDYWLEDNKLQKQIDFLKKNPNYNFCFTRFKTLNQNTGEMKDDFNGKYFTKNDFIDFGYEIFQKGWHIGTQTLVFKNDKEFVRVSQKFKFFRDVHIIALSLKDGLGACLNFFGAVYRIHDGGIHTSVTEYNGYKIGYLTHKEIYLDNKTNKYLRHKYLHSYKNFINANIRAGDLSKALWMSIDLLFKNGKTIDFLKHQKRILVKLFGRNEK